MISTSRIAPPTTDLPAYNARARLPPPPRARTGAAGFVSCPQTPRLTMGNPLLTARGLNA
eukprot:8013975-Lingulodinium_polyedra.AAC.1